MYTVATGLLVGCLATSVISSHDDVVFGRSKCWAKVHQFEILSTAPVLSRCPSLGRTVEWISKLHGRLEFVEALNRKTHLFTL